MDEIRKIVHDLLSDSVAANKRRAAIKQGRVESVTEGCPHYGWDDVKHWCTDCEITLRELVIRHDGE